MFNITNGDGVISVKWFWRIEYEARLLFTFGLFRNFAPIQVAGYGARIKPKFTLAYGSYNVT